MVRDTDKKVWNPTKRIDVHVKLALPLNIFSLEKNYQYMCVVSYVGNDISNDPLSICRPARFLRLFATLSSLAIYKLTLITTSHAIKTDTKTCFLLRPTTLILTG